MDQSIRPIELICRKCALETSGGQVPAGHIPTWNMLACDVCGQVTEVTQPRDFRPRPDASPRGGKGAQS